jgi:hypothetical protein
MEHSGAVGQQQSDEFIALLQLGDSNVEGRMLSPRIRIFQLTDDTASSKNMTIHYARNFSGVYVGHKLVRLIQCRDCQPIIQSLMIACGVGGDSE